jgi:hypothetical protein
MDGQVSDVRIEPVKDVERFATLHCRWMNLKSGIHPYVCL